MAFHCVTCSNSVIISRTEYLFLSLQPVMSVGKTAGFLSSNWISELVWDSECEEENYKIFKLNDLNGCWGKNSVPLI